MRCVKAILEHILMMSHILLVDDDQDIICSFRSILEDEGYVVHAANDADEVVKIIRDNEIHLAIMDYVLPRARGDKLAETLMTINQKLSWPILSESMRPVIFGYQ